MLPRWSVGLFCNKSKSTCVDIQENVSQKIAAIWTPHCGGKRDGCVLSAAKINILFRNRAVFRRKCFGFSVRRNTLKKNLWTFLRNLSVFLHSPSLFLEKGAFLPPLRPAQFFPAHHHALSRTRACASRTQRVRNLCLHPSPSLLTRCILVVYG